MPLTLAARVADLLQCQTIPITDTPPTDTATVQLVSTRINGPDTISVVVLRCPHLIPSDILDKIFKITLLYTARAFLVPDISTMSAEDREDHLVHTFSGGGNVFLLGKDSTCTSTTTTTTTNNTDESLELYAHANFHSYAIPEYGTALYLSGVCCDPNQQGRGFATTIMTDAVALLRQMEGVKYLTMRTMNHNVVKMCKKLKLAATETDAEADAEAISVVKVYPVDTIGENRQDLVHVCNTLSHILEWNQGVVPERLIIESAYPDFLIPIFRGSNNKGKEDAIRDRVDEIINRDRGDAMCLIIDM
jgi:hypothetical protein